MPEEIYKKTYYLKEDLAIGRIEIEYLLALFEKRGLEGVRAHFAMGEERTITASDIEEIRAVEEQKYNVFTRITIFAGVRNAEVVVFFYPNPKEEYELNFTSASYLQVESSDVELIYMIKAIWEMFTDRYRPRTRIRSR